jgi:tetratricopeptide (TPR) repeat protein
VASVTADSLLNSGNYKSALKNYYQLLELDEKNHLEKNIAKDHNNIAITYQNMADYRKAMEHYYKALRLSEKQSDPELSGTLNMNIGSLHSALGNLNDAGSSLEKAITQLQLAKKYKPLSQAFMNLALLMDIKGDRVKSEEYFDQAEKISKENNIPEVLANVYVNRSYIFTEQGNYKKAIQFAYKAKDVYALLNDKAAMATAYVNMQAAYTGQFKHASDPGFKSAVKQGIAYLDTALLLLRNIESPEHHIHIYRNKAISYVRLGEVDSADVYLNKYEVMKDSVYNLDKQKQVEELKLKYETEKKEQEIKLLEKENALLAEKTQKRKLYFMVLLAGTVFLIVLILMIGNYRRKQRQSEQAKDKAVFELQALMAQMNPHFIFNALNSIQHFILEKGKQEAYDYLAKFSKLVRMVLNNSEDKMVSLQKELELIELYVELEQLRFADGFKYQLSISEEVDTEDSELPTMLIQPYVENAIWHGLMNLNNERHGVLKISIDKPNGKLRISIEDNGVGRKRAEQFRKDEMHAPKGMKLTERRLQMVNAMKDYENASVKIYDLPDNSGTRVEILL